MSAASLPKKICIFQTTAVWVSTLGWTLCPLWHLIHLPLILLGITFPPRVRPSERQHRREFKTGQSDSLRGETPDTATAAREELWKPFPGSWSDDLMAWRGGRPCDRRSDALSKGHAHTCQRVHTDPGLHYLLMSINGGWSGESAEPTSHTMCICISSKISLVMFREVNSQGQNLCKALNQVTVSSLLAGCCKSSATLCALLIQ